MDIRDLRKVFKSENCRTIFLIYLYFFIFSNNRGRIFKVFYDFQFVWVQISPTPYTDSKTNSPFSVFITDVAGRDQFSRGYRRIIDNVFQNLQGRKEDHDSDCKNTRRLLINFVDRNLSSSIIYERKIDTQRYREDSWISEITTRSTPVVYLHVE